MDIESKLKSIFNYLILKKKADGAITVKKTCKLIVIAYKKTFIARNLQSFYKIFTLYYGIYYCWGLFIGLLTQFFVIPMRK